METENIGLEMMEAAGVKETAELLMFVMSIGEGVVNSLEDGRISLFDASYFFDALGNAIDAFSNFSGAITEMRNLGDDQKALLQKFIEFNFDIPQDALERRIEKALVAAVGLADMIGDWSNDSEK